MRTKNSDSRKLKKITIGLNGTKNDRKFKAVSSEKLSALFNKYLHSYLLTVVINDKVPQKPEYFLKLLLSPPCI